MERKRRRVVLIGMDFCPAAAIAASIAEKANAQVWIDAASTDTGHPFQAFIQHPTKAKVKRRKK